MGSIGSLPQASTAGPQPGRNAGSTDTQSQAGSTSFQAVSVSSPQAGSGAGTLPLVSSTSPQPGRNAACQHSIPSR